MSFADKAYKEVLKQLKKEGKEFIFCEECNTEEYKSIAADYGMLEQEDSSFPEEILEQKSVPDIINAFKNYYSENYYNLENTFNLLNFNYIIESFNSHKGNCATDLFRAKFKDMAMAMSVLPYNETLARYSVVNEVNTLLLTFNNGLELNVTQSIEQEEVAFSIHHNGEMLFVGSSSPADLAKKMLHVINEPISFEDGLS